MTTHSFAFFKEQVAYIGFCRGPHPQEMAVDHRNAEAAKPQVHQTRGVEQAKIGSESEDSCVHPRSSPAIQKSICIIPGHGPPQLHYSRPWAEQVALFRAMDPERRRNKRRTKGGPCIIPGHRVGHLHDSGPWFA